MILRVPALTGRIIRWTAMAGLCFCSLELWKTVSVELRYISEFQNKSIVVSSINRRMDLGNFHRITNYVARSYLKHESKTSHTHGKSNIAGNPTLILQQ